MTLTITINCDHAAFEDAPGAEVARILRRLAGLADQSVPSLNGCKLYDVNGNAVGLVQVHDRGRRC